ncbi:putative serine carboxypeptidase S28 family protein [Blattamonas nauphoetae]|uniref:Serine carboxypeptidase S28 family protein n=1 Tax=Blattamonas nauphoetae TaxID=2049346 RepID=A0ABQ9XYB3_9EUKA|nr:putative serine carboxypeptidase S28 family protein [Blattamonas nauphoetae]
MWTYTFRSRNGIRISTSRQQRRSADRRTAPIMEPREEPEWSQLEAVRWMVWLTGNTTDVEYPMNNPVCWHSPGAASGQYCGETVDIAHQSFTTTLKERMNKFVGTIFEYLETDCFDFSSSRERLSSDVVSETQSSRQWMYQVCTEFGYFQVAPAENSLRSALIDSQYHLDLCKAIFGKEFVPNIEGINRRYGGLDVKGNNIIFSNGEKDPWKMLSILNASLATRTSTAGTSNGGHVVPEDGRVGTTITHPSF